MRLNKTTEYAIRVIVYMARNSDTRFSTMRLHKELHIPYKYLGRLMSKLAAGGFLEVTAGKSGGYKIIKELSSIYLYQIAELVEGLQDFDRCLLGFDKCSDDNPCSLHHQWADIRESIKQLFYTTNLANLDYDGICKY